MDLRACAVRAACLAGRPRTLRQALPRRHGGACPGRPLSMVLTRPGGVGPAGGWGGAAAAADGDPRSVSRTDGG